MKMNETVQIAIISAGLAALINCVFQFVNKLIDNAKERRQNQDKKVEEYIEKKEKVYIAALQRLIQIRYGFDYTRDMLAHNKVLQEKVDKENLVFSQISPQLRLYSTDRIFNTYRELATYARFAYAPQDGQRLIENSKWAFDTQITLLARLMQEDLGYREYNDGLDVVICPKCGCEHDVISKCPICKMTYNELQEKAKEVLEQMREIQNEEGK